MRQYLATHKIIAHNYSIPIPLSIQIRWRLMAARWKVLLFLLLLSFSAAQAENSQTRWGLPAHSCDLPITHTPVQFALPPNCRLVSIPVGAYPNDEEIYGAGTRAKIIYFDTPARNSQQTLLNDVVVLGLEPSTYATKPKRGEVRRRVLWVMANADDLSAQMTNLTVSGRVFQGVPMGGAR